MARSRVKLLLIIGILIIAAGGFFVWEYSSAWESTDDAQIDGHINPVSSKISGTVLKVHVTDNQKVQQGDLLVEVDPRDYEIAVARARAALADAEAEARAANAQVPLATSSSGTQIGTAEAGAESARSGVAAAEREILAGQARKRVAEARLAEAKANAMKAQRDLERMTTLVEKEEISRQQYDTAVAAAESARAAVESAEAAVLQAEHEIAVAEARIGQARAALARAQAELEGSKTAPQEVAVTRAKAASATARMDLAKAALDQALVDLENTKIKAPVSGVVSRKTVEIGQVLQRGQPLLALIPRENVWVTANFKETQLDVIYPGLEATVSVDALNGREFKAHVESIASATGARFSLLPPENATGNYVKVVQRVPVKIVFDGDQEGLDRLSPGMSVIVDVRVKGNAGPR